jgi:hypothetical protein
MSGTVKTPMILNLDQARSLLVKADEHIMRMAKIAEQQAILTNQANASLRQYIDEYKKITEPALRLIEEANNGHG